VSEEEMRRRREAAMAAPAKWRTGRTRQRLLASTSRYANEWLWTRLHAVRLPDETEVERYQKEHEVEHGANGEIDRRATDDDDCRDEHRVHAGFGKVTMEDAPRLALCSATASRFWAGRRTCSVDHNCRTHTSTGDFVAVIVIIDDQYMTAGVRRTYVSSVSWRSMKSARSAREIRGTRDVAYMSTPWR